MNVSKYFESSFCDTGRSVSEVRKVSIRLTCHVKDESYLGLDTPIYIYFPRVTEVERITKDKEQSQRLLDEQNNEISTLKSLREKLTIQLEEREKNFLQLQQQNDRMAEMMSTNTKASGDFKEERDSLQVRKNGTNVFHLL